MHWLTLSFGFVVLVAGSFAKEHQKDEFAQWFLKLKSLIKDCPKPPNNKSNTKSDFLLTLRYCMQTRALDALDSLFSNEIIPIINGVELVYFKAVNSSIEETERDSEVAREKEDKNMFEIILKRIRNVFKTHVLKIDVDELSRSFHPNRNPKMVVEGRKRNRRRFNMLPLIATGLLLMGSVIIPLGFQFLAVLGGKALLLAKMALLLSSIQGLKKVATNSMNYGFYHSNYPEHYDRSHLDPSLLSGSSPPYSTYHYHP